MISHLILFCGGDAIYEGNKPKPLLQMPNKYSILENYLQQDSIQEISQVTLITESQFSHEINEVASKFNLPSRIIHTISTNQKTSTLDKLRMFAALDSSVGSNLLFTYPDIFYFGDWERILSSNITNGKMLITGVPLQSRFSEISFDPYTKRVRSVSLRPKRVPANSSTIYAGHFMTDLINLKSALTLFDKYSAGARDLTLEGDFFTFLVSSTLLETLILESKWIKADSYKEMLSIVQSLKSHEQ